MNTSARLLEDIEAFLQRHRMSATAFGLAAINDGHLVRRLRKGRGVNSRTLDRVKLYMAKTDGKIRPSKRAEARLAV